MFDVLKDRGFLTPFKNYCRLDSNRKFKMGTENFDYGGGVP